MVWESNRSEGNELQYLPPDTPLAGIITLSMASIPLNAILNWRGVVRSRKPAPDGIVMPGAIPLPAPAAKSWKYAAKP
jgi:hypothetical protein